MEVTLDPSFVHRGLQKLHINSNLFPSWPSLVPLSTSLPSLHTLVAIGNPLEVIPEVAEGEFPSLRSLTLNSTKISKWRSVENLASLSALRDLSLLRVPIGQRMKEKERRFAAIARLPLLERLNKSAVSETEREDAERWAIRRYSNQDQPPTFYQRLVEKHGRLQPLVDVELWPHTEATLQFRFDCGKQENVEVHTVCLQQSTADLKRWVAHRLGHAPSRLRLFFVSMEVLQACKGYYEHDVMERAGKPLYAYDMKDGDEVHVMVLV